MSNSKSDNSMSDNSMSDDSINDNFENDDELEDLLNYYTFLNDAEDIYNGIYNGKDIEEEIENIRLALSDDEKEIIKEADDLSYYNHNYNDVPIVEELHNLLEFFEYFNTKYKIILLFSKIKVCHYSIYHFFIRQFGYLIYNYEIILNNKIATNEILETPAYELKNRFEKLYGWFLSEKIINLLYGEFLRGHLDGVSLIEGGFSEVIFEYTDNLIHRYRYIRNVENDNPVNDPMSDDESVDDESDEVSDDESDDEIEEYYLIISKFMFRMLNNSFLQPKYKSEYISNALSIYNKYPLQYRTERDKLFKKISDNLPDLDLSEVIFY